MTPVCPAALRSSRAHPPPEQVTTTNGSLRVGIEKADPASNHDLNHKYGMLQSRNKLCFTGGYIEGARPRPPPSVPSAFSLTCPLRSRCVVPRLQQQRRGLCESARTQTMTRRVAHGQPGPPRLRRVHGRHVAVLVCTPPLLPASVQLQLTAPPAGTPRATRARSRTQTAGATSTTLRWGGSRGSASRECRAHALPPCSCLTDTRAVPSCPTDTALITDAAVAHARVPPTLRSTPAPRRRSTCSKKNKLGAGGKVLQSAPFMYDYISPKRDGRGEVL